MFDGIDMGNAYILNIMFDEPDFELIKPQAFGV
jgi:hypothetical protein